MVLSSNGKLKWRKWENMSKTKMMEQRLWVPTFCKFLFPRGGKSKQGKGKNGKKGSGKKEGYDLIVHIDLQEWKLSDDMVTNMALRILIQILVGRAFQTSITRYDS